MKLLLIYTLLLITSLASSQECITSFETYVVYDDYLPIYDTVNGNEIGQFKFEVDSTFDFGKTISFSEGKNGWLRIMNISTNLDIKKYKEKWIKSEYVVVTTNNYGGDSIPVIRWDNPENKVIDYLTKETTFNVQGFCDEHVQVIHNGVLGWIWEKNICTNEVTNCN